MSQVSGDQRVGEAEGVDGAVKLVEGRPEFGVGCSVGGDDLSQAGAEEAGEGAGEEEGGAEAGRGELVVSTRVRNRPGVRRVMRRSKMSWTWSGRPRSSCSRITSSKKRRPVPGRSNTWASENSAWRIE